MGFHPIYTYTNSYHSAADKAALWFLAGLKVLMM